MERPVFLSDSGDTSIKTTINTSKIHTPTHESQELSETKQQDTGTEAEVQFNVTVLHDFIHKRGIPTSWQQSFICPCANSMTLAPDPLCPICHGTGIGYLKAKDNTYVMLQSQNRGAGSNRDLGMFEAGSAVGTFDTETRIDTMDRITLPDSVVRQNYMFNVTEERFSDGYYIPYDVREFLFVSVLINGKLHHLNEFGDYTYNNTSHKITILNEKLIGCNITMMLNVTLRYIVSNLLKDVRYQYSKAKSVNITYNDLPRLAVLRRESAFINNVPIVPEDTEDEVTTKVTNSTPDYIKDASSDNGFGLRGI